MIESTKEGFINRETQERYKAQEKCRHRRWMARCSMPKCGKIMGSDALSILHQNSEDFPHSIEEIPDYLKEPLLLQAKNEIFAEVIKGDPRNDFKELQQAFYNDISKKAAKLLKYNDCTVIEDGKIVRKLPSTYPKETNTLEYTRKYEFNEGIAETLKLVAQVLNAK